MSPHIHTLVFQYGTLIALTTAELLSPRTGLAAAEQMLFDFEKPGLGDDWTAMGKIEVARKPIPQADLDQNPARPKGNGVLISVDRSGGLFSKSGRVAADWRSNRRIRFWIYRSPTEADERQASTMELQMLEADGRARFWRKITLSHTGWKQFDIELRKMRWGPGRVPRYDRIDKLGFWFRDPAEVAIDHVRYEKTGSNSATGFSTDELRAVAFPEIPADEVFSTQRPSVRLLTDEPNLQLEKLADHLEAVGRKIQKTLRLDQPPAIPPTLIVFSTRQLYQEFPPRFAKLLNSAVDQPRSQGFTLHGISTSYWEPKIGTLRPVYTHEYVHSYLAFAALIQNQGGWFQEGLASYFQIDFHPQADLAKIISQGAENPQQHLPLDRLCNGRRIPTNRYWQALTLIEMMLTHPDYKQKFPLLIAAFQKTGSTNLESVRDEVLGQSRAELYENWQSFCRRKYARQAGGAEQTGESQSRSGSKVNR